MKFYKNLATNSINKVFVYVPLVIGVAESAQSIVIEIIVHEIQLDIL